MSERRSRNGLWTLAAVGAGGAVGAAAVFSRRRPPGAASWDEEIHPFAAPAVEPEILTATSADGADLHVRVYGPRDGEPIVFAHGWTCSAEFWNPQVNALAEKYRVVTYDQRGHGRSAIGEAPLTADVLADDLSAVLAATVDDGRKATIVGHSMGGMSIVAWAGNYPDQVGQYAHSVLLASTGTDSLVAETAVVPLPQRFPRLPVPVARAVLGSSVPVPANPVTTRALKYIALSPGAGPAEVAFCARIVLGCQPRTRGGWGHALSTLDIRHGLHNLHAPTSVLVGTADRLTPPSHARRLAQALAEADNLERLIELDGIGHMTSVEAVDHFTGEVERLRNLTAR